MAWWDSLFAPLGFAPDVTVPIPPGTVAPRTFQPGTIAPFNQGPADLHSSIYGSPFIPTPFDAPNTFRPGAQPGQMDVAPKPEARNPMLAASPPPMMGKPLEPSLYQEGAPPPFMPGTYEGMRVDDPNFKQPTQAEAPKPPNFYERNKDWITMLSKDLGALGQVMVMAPPGVNPYGYGFANITQDRKGRIQEEKAQLELEGLRAKGESLKAAKELAKSLPANHPARPYFALGLVEKGLEQITPDYNKLIITGPDGKPQLNATLMNAKAYIEAAGKFTWGVVGHDAGGKPIYSWVSPLGTPGASPGSMPGATPGTAPTMPSTQPGYSPGAPSGPVTTSGPPSSPQGAVPPPPPGVDPYKWAEEQAKLRIQQQANERGRRERAPIVLQDIDRALEAIKDQGLRTGFPGVMARQIPGTGADRLERLLDGVRAQIGFDQLNQMRQQSPTGAALGSVTERELNFLQSVMGSLSISQGEDQLRFNLRRLKNAMLDVIHGEGKGPQREKLEATPTQGGRVDTGKKMGGKAVYWNPTTRKYEVD